MFSIVVKTGAVLNCKFGQFDHGLMIGRSYGSKVYSRNQKGFVYLLRPTPELWSRVLPHRTQLVYPTDGSFIVGQLQLGMGSTVVESGTGSGSFTHFLARAVGHGGKVITREFHAQRAQQAR